jgi:hypothetical protein
MKRSIGAMRMVMVMLVLAGWASGCRLSPQDPWQATGSYPADFALVLVVQVAQDAATPAERPAEDEAAATDPTRQPSQYILEPDRTLRVALGPGVSQRIYPPATASLSPAEVGELHALVERGDLMHFQPPGPPAGPVRYQVILTAQGRTHRYETGPQDSPATEALLRRLVVLRGGKLAPQP